MFRPKVCLFLDGNTSDVNFSRFSLYPSQHCHLYCVLLVLLTFPYRPTFCTECHCGSNCCFIDLVLQYFWDFSVKTILCKIVDGAVGMTTTKNDANVTLAPI